MVPVNECPVCESRDVRRIASLRQEISSTPKSAEEARITVILQFVLQERSICLDTMFCRTCRHLFTVPTFDSEEIERLYSREYDLRYREVERDMRRRTGVTWAQENRLDKKDVVSLAWQAADERASFMRSLLDRMGVDGSSKLLDYGGMNGRLIRDVRCRKYVLDRVPHEMLGGAIRLKNDEEMFRCGPYDVIVLAHVLEHVPFPVSFLTSMTKVITGKGILFVEVPLEYPYFYYKKRGRPLGGHVGGFSMTSLKTALSRAGFSKVLYSRATIAPYGEMRIPIVRVVGQRSEAQGRSVPPPWLLEYGRDLLLSFVAARVIR